MLSRLTVHFVVFAVLCCNVVRSDELTIERIYQKNEFKTRSYSVRWTDEDNYVRLEANQTVGGSDIVQYNCKTGKRSVVVSAELMVPSGSSKPLTVDDYQFSDGRNLVLIYTNSKRVWRVNSRGDYWILDRGSRQLTQLGGDAPASTLMFAKLSPDGSQVAYVRNKNIYVENVQSREIFQLTRSDSDTVINGTADWVYEEEFRVRDGFRWSPSGKSIAYFQIDTAGVDRFPLVNQTDSLYPNIRWFTYPKVGRKNPACRIGIISVERDAEPEWVNIADDLRNNYVTRINWLPDSDKLLVRKMNRRQDRETLFLVKKGKPRQVMFEHDKAWVSVHDELFWLKKGEAFTWISERDGWRHVYKVDIKSGKAQRVTDQPFDVIRLLGVDEKKGWIYYLASPDNATQKYLYRSSLKGDTTERVSPANQSGTHGYQIAPGARWAIHQHSSLQSPPRFALVNLPSHEQTKKLENNDDVRKKLANMASVTSEFLRVPINKETELDGWCIRPTEIEKGKKYPLLIYVYGEPAGQTVLDRWGGATAMWHRMLAKQGYVVMSFDNRGTPAPRGRKWRKRVYGRVGIDAPKDQHAALQTILDQRSYLDRKRVGIWGWSGGGSMSLNAIFKYPDSYRTAISIAPVPNQRYYDTIYQERYMGLPKDNPEGFIKGSPINYAHQLKGNLLLIHGTGDDNCHYQTMEMLINRLIKHKKQFSMMAYPNRSHSIREGTGTTVHLRTLMTNYLLKNL